MRSGGGSGLRPNRQGSGGGGADILGVYNTAVYRIQGVPTAMAFLPYDDCNALTLAHAQVMWWPGTSLLCWGLAPTIPADPWTVSDCAEELGAAG